MLGDIKKLEEKKEAGDEEEDDDDAEHEEEKVPPPKVPKEKEINADKEALAALREGEKLVSKVFVQ